MRLKRENRGFSLVELVVVIAIFSVVSIAIGGFLVAAQRSYSVSANELDIQEEAQLVANQLQEMILDTSLGISYQYVVVDDAGTELIDFMTDDSSTSLPEGDLAKKELYIYGLDYYYHIYWNAESSELYFAEYKKTGATPELVDGMTSDGVILGEYVTDFQIDLSKIGTEKMVSFDITFKKPGGDRAYTVTRNISIRNNILMNKSSTDVYNSVGLEFEPVATNLSVTPTSAIKWPGETLPFNILLTCSRGGVPSQDVSWNYSSGDGIPLDSNTKVNASGVLTIGSNEKSTIINLVASAPGMDYDEDREITLKENIVVNIKQITGLSIVRNDFATSPVSPNGTYIVEVALTGVNLSGETLTGAGGIEANVEMGGSYVTITDEEELVGLKKKFTIQLSSSVPEGTDIALSFKPGRAEFADIVASTGIYKVGNSTNQIFNLESASGVEWERLGSSKVILDFASDDMEDAYTDASGNLLSGYFIRYNYEVYDSDFVLKRTAYKSTGMNGNLYTDYFTSVGTSTSEDASVLYMTDRPFEASGTVVVRADLMYNTAGTPVVVGSSNNVSYTIPQATIGFRRAAADTPSSNLKVYMTSKTNKMPIYVSFSSGYAENTYSLNMGSAVCTPSELGKVTNYDGTQRRFFIEGNADAEYLMEKNNVFTFTYGGLPNTVTIQLVEPNISGTDWYAPVNLSEWALLSSTIEEVTEGDDVKEIRTDKYIYYMDDTHKMEMTYVNDVFQVATYSILENNVWKKIADYTVNRVTSAWDLVTP